MNGMKNINWRTTAFSAEYAYHCQSELVVASSRYVSAVSTVPTRIAVRGPRASMKRPISGPESPLTNSAEENPSDTSARVQPNSCSSGCT